MENMSKKFLEVKVENNEWQLRAATDITAGETILEEAPLFVSTGLQNEQLRCTSCFQESFVMCKKCSFFPICLDCISHDEFDCNFFQNAELTRNVSKNLLVTNYAIFGILKFLLLKENPVTSKICEDILAKDLNFVDYCKDDVWKKCKEKLVISFMESGLVGAFKRTKVDPDFLHKLLILIEMHSFELFNENNELLNGMYVCSAKLPHNCVPNAVASINEDFTIKIYATANIKKGEIIYNSYTNPLMGTSQRQQYLRRTKRFDCNCKRCQDPTELDTNLSSIKCLNCEKGFAICDLSQTKNWICEKCSAVMEASEVNKLLAEIETEIINANGDLRVLEYLLKKYETKFHKNHFIIISIKQNIIKILGLILANIINKPGKLVFERKLKLCEDILPVLYNVTPGISRFYAVALFEYLLPYTELAVMEFENNEINKNVYIEKLQKAKSIATTIESHLRFEPFGSNEKSVSIFVRMEQRNIEQLLKEISD